MLVRIISIFYLCHVIVSVEIYSLPPHIESEITCSNISDCYGFGIDVDSCSNGKCLIRTSTYITCDTSAHCEGMTNSQCVDGFCHCMTSYAASLFKYDECVTIEIDKRWDRELMMSAQNEIWVDGKSLPIIQKYSTLIALGVIVFTIATLFACILEMYNKRAKAIREQSKVEKAKKRVKDEADKQIGMLKQIVAPVHAVTMGQRRQSRLSAGARSEPQQPADPKDITPVVEPAEDRKLERFESKPEDYLPPYQPEEQELPTQLESEVPPSSAGKKNSKSPSKGSSNCGSLKVSLAQATVTQVDSKPQFPNKAPSMEGTTVLKESEVKSHDE